MAANIQIQKRADGDWLAYNSVLEIYATGHTYERALEEILDASRAFFADDHERDYGVRIPSPQVFNQKGGV